MTSTSTSTSTSTAIAELKRLRRYGFRVEPILTEDGTAEVVYFVREFKGWREVVLVYSVREARAYRTPVDRAAENPLHVPPGTADVLIPLDDVVTVVQTLLSLPAPPPRHTWTPPGATP